MVNDVRVLLFTLAASTQQRAPVCLSLQELQSYLVAPVPCKRCNCDHCHAVCQPQCAVPLLHSRYVYLRSGLMLSGTGSGVLSSCRACRCPHICRPSPVVVGVSNMTCHEGKARCFLVRGQLMLVSSLGALDTTVNWKASH